MSWFGTPHFAMQILFGRALQTHARHDIAACGGENTARVRPKTLRAAPEDVDHNLSILTLARIGHARHEPQASGAVSLLSAIATALSTAATAALEVVVVRPALVALLDEGLRAAGHVVEHRAHSLVGVLVRCSAPKTPCRGTSCSDGGHASRPTCN